MIAEILRRVGVTRRFFVEFGAEDGAEGNCAALAADGWSGLLMEADPGKFCTLEATWRHRADVVTRRAMVTPETVDLLFAGAHVPRDLDVVSIDVDSCDWHIWQALTSYEPRLVVIEYNAALPLNRQFVQPLELAGNWDGTDWFGASLGALEALGQRKGYALVHTDRCGVNAFFVRRSLLPGTGLPLGPAVHCRPPNYFGSGRGHPRDPLNRPWLDIDSGELVRL